MTITVTPESLVALGPLVAGNRSQLSPFNAAFEGVLREADRHLVNDAAEELAVLARPRSVTRIQLAGSGGVFEYSVYFDSHGRSVALQTSRHGVLIEGNPSSAETLEYLANMIGSSVIVGAEFGTTLSAMDALVFAGLVDHERKRQLLTLATGTAPKDDPDAASIDRSLNEPSGGFLRLSNAVSRVVGEALPSVSQIEDSLGSLDRSAVAALASSMLNVEMVMTVLVLSENDDGSLTKLELVCPIAGLHGVLAIERVGHNVRMETISSAGLLRLANYYLTEPDALASADAIAAVSSADDAG